MDATERRSRLAAKRKSCFISAEVRIDRVSSFKRGIVASRNFCTANVLPFTVSCNARIDSIFQMYFQ